MSDSSSISPRPVSLVTIFAILGCFGLFALLVYLAYLPHRPAPPQAAAAEKLPADQAWKATAESRRAVLLDMRAKQQQQATTYAWVDQKAGIVQLPIARAMELVVRDHSSKK